MRGGERGEPQENKREEEQRNMANDEPLNWIGKLRQFRKKYLPRRGGLSISDHALPFFAQDARSEIDLINDDDSRSSARAYRYWQMFVALLILYTAFITPIEVGVLHDIRGLRIMDYIVELVFLADMFLSLFSVCCLPIFQFSLLDVGWFIVELLSLIASVLSMFPIIPSYPSWLFLLRLVRLSCLAKIPVNARVQKKEKFPFVCFEVIKLVLVLLWSLNAGACLFYSVEGTDSIKFDSKTPSLWEKYIAAMYWSITTISTVGYGDMYPQSSLGRLLITIFIIFIVGVVAYFNATFTTLFIVWPTAIKKFRDSLSALSACARRWGLTPILTNEIKAHFRLRLGKRLDGSQQEKEMMELLPQATCLAIAEQRFRPVLMNVYLFKNVSESMLYYILSNIEVECFPRNTTMILQHQPSSYFYILVSGEVHLEVVTEEGEGDGKRKVVRPDVKKNKPGDVFGEIGVMCYRPQVFKVCSTVECKVIKLSHTTFIEAAYTNSRDVHIIWNNFAKEPIDKYMGIALESANYATPFPKLREKILDPNEANERGRTPLHVAAFKGNIDAAKILLGCGADISIRDSHNRGPLNHALRGGCEGHDTTAIVDFLESKGVTRQYLGPGSQKD